jgi:hypothetical protein
MARATWLWLALHVAGAVGAGAFGFPVVYISLAGMVWVWGFTAFGVHVLTTRRGESLILANLGFSPWRTAGMVVAWCAALDGCLQIVVVVST